MKKFNLNHYVYVKLNDRGKGIIEEDPTHSKYTKPDKDGFYKFQLWEFMTVFSPHLNMETDIISEENSLFFNEKDFQD